MRGRCTTSWDARERFPKDALAGERKASKFAAPEGVADWNLHPQYQFDDYHVVVYPGTAAQELLGSTTAFTAQDGDRPFGRCEAKLKLRHAGEDGRARAICRSAGMRVHAGL